MSSLSEQLLLCSHSVFGQSTVNYSPSTDVFPNPERGFLQAERTHSWGLPSPWTWRLFRVQARWNHDCRACLLS